MELENYKILALDRVLTSIAEIKLKGKLKFKIFKNKLELENKSAVIFKSLEGLDIDKDKDEVSEISDVLQEVDIDLFTMDELEDLPLSLKDLSILQFIIDDKELA